MRTLGAVLATAVAAAPALMLLGCDSGDGGGWHEVGECEPPAGTDLPIDSTTVLDRFATDSACFDGLGAGLVVIDSQAAWDAQFACATPPPVPANIDFATERAAVIQLDCAPFDHTFTVETADEMVIGVHSHVSGACLGNVDVVPLPRSSKSVRLAECHDECGDCPPVP